MPSNIQEQSSTQGREEWNMGKNMTDMEESADSERLSNYLHTKPNKPVGSSIYTVQVLRCVQSVSVRSRHREGSLVFGTSSLYQMSVCLWSLHGLQSKQILSVFLLNNECDFPQPSCAACVVLTRQKGTAYMRSTSSSSLVCWRANI